MTRFEHCQVANKLIVWLERKKLNPSDALEILAIVCATMLAVIVGTGKISRENATGGLNQRVLGLLKELERQK